MKLKKALFILMLIICLYFLTGCTNDGQGVESKAYVIAIGIDKR